MDQEKVLLTFSGPVPEFNSLADVNVPSGSLSKMTSDDKISWKGFFTPSLNTKVAYNEMALKTVLADCEGKDYEITGTTPNYIVDTLNISVERFIMSSTTLISTLDFSAAVVTLVFSEPLDDPFDSVCDISATNAILNNMTSIDNKVWVGTLIPFPNVTDSSNVLHLITNITGLNGNNVTIDMYSANYQVKSANISIISFLVSAHITSVLAEDRPDATLVFSEPVSNFNSDAVITADNGRLSLMTPDISDNRIWSGLLDISRNICDSTNKLHLNATVTGRNGISMALASTSNNYIIQTNDILLRSFVVSDASFDNLSRDASATLYFSEPVQGIDVEDIMVDPPSAGQVEIIEPSVEKLHIWTIKFMSAAGMNSISTILRFNKQIIGSNKYLATIELSTAPFIVNTPAAYVVSFYFNSYLLTTANPCTTWTLVFSEAVDSLDGAVFDANVMEGHSTVATFDTPPAALDGSFKTWTGRISAIGDGILDITNRASFRLDGFTGINGIQVNLYKETECYGVST